MPDNEMNTLPQKHFSPINLNYLKSLLLNINWDAVHFITGKEECYKYNSTLLATDRKIKKKNKKKNVCKNNDAKNLKDGYLKTLFKYEMTGDIQDKQFMVDRKKNYDQKLRALPQDVNAYFI